MKQLSTIQLSFDSLLLKLQNASAHPNDPKISDVEKSDFIHLCTRFLEHQKVQNIESFSTPAETILSRKINEFYANPTTEIFQHFQVLIDLLETHNIELVDDKDRQKHHDIAALRSYVLTLNWFQLLFFPTALMEELYLFDPFSPTGAKAHHVYKAYQKPTGIFDSLLIWIGRQFLSGFKKFAAADSTFTALNAQETTSQGSDVKHSDSSRLTNAAERRNGNNSAEQPQSHPVITSSASYQPFFKPSAVADNNQSVLSYGATHSSVVTVSLTRSPSSTSPAINNASFEGEGPGCH